MLILSRKVGEQIVLPSQGIVVTVLEIGRNQVRLGITAPRDIAIHRSEVWNRRRDEEKAAHAPGVVTTSCLISVSES